MKKISIATILFSFFLVGCQTYKNDYLSEKAVPASDEIIGYWTGMTGNILTHLVTTIEIHKDGTGVRCDSLHGGMYNFSKIVYSGDRIVAEDGEKMLIQQLTDTDLIVKGNLTYYFYKDNDLAKSSFYCMARLKGSIK